MVTVKQLADELGVSKQAVHKKIEKMGIKKDLQTVNRKLMIDDNQAKAIKKAFFIESGEMHRQPTVNNDNQFTTTEQNQKQTKIDGFCVKNGCQPVDEEPTTKRQPVDDNQEKREPDRDRTDNQAKLYSVEYVELLLERIEDLKEDKVNLQKALDQQQQLSLLDKQEIMKLNERLALVAPAEAEPEPEEPAEPKEPEPKKKGFFARLFGG